MVLRAEKIVSQTKSRRLKRRESRKNRVSGEAEAVEGAESRKNRLSDEVEAAEGAESRKNRVSDGSR